MLEVKNITKKYKNTYAINNLSLNVKEGEISILLGPNGSGKTTTIKSIAGLINYKGKILICGYDNKTIKAKQNFGYIPEIAIYYDNLSIEEHLEFIARAYNLKNYHNKIIDLLKCFNLYENKDKLAKNLSKGMKQKLCICCALLPDPKVIVFDEPMSGLDPYAIKVLKEKIIELRDKGCSILISTHMIESIYDIYDTVNIIYKGNNKKTLSKSQIENGDKNLEQIFFDITK